MSANFPEQRQSQRRSRRRELRPLQLLPWLDVGAIALWGILLLRYWLTGKLNLLIHPNYTWLTIVTGVALLLVSALKLLELVRKPQLASAVQHFTLFPPGWSSGLLILVAIFALLVEPRAFASQTAIQRGITDSLTATRVRPQAFRGTIRPETRSLIDWIRTLNVYPEPDAYTGQKAKVQGFVTHPPLTELPAQYLLLSRFVITCCAADVYPIGLPVKLSQGNRDTYKPDTWLEVAGQMTTETLAGKRQLVIQATSLKPIPEPRNPYDY